MCIFCDKSVIIKAQIRRLSSHYDNDMSLFWQEVFELYKYSYHHQSNLLLILNIHFPSIKPKLDSLLLLL
jgi:hypothetical protein